MKENWDELLRQQERSGMKPMLARKKIGHLKSKRLATRSQKDRPPCGKVPGCPSNRIWGGVDGQKKEPTGWSSPDGEGAQRTAAV
jgi:hypothetical protein